MPRNAWLLAGSAELQTANRERQTASVKLRSSNSKPRTPNRRRRTENGERRTLVPMCGIAGFIGRGERLDLERMIDLLAHRGPDGAGVWTDQPVFFGHRRLSIVDLAAGAQPMTTLDDDLVITFNGEIYNHVELRKQLEQLGHRFKTDHSDTEVLLY